MSADERRKVTAGNAGAYAFYREGQSLAKSNPIRGRGSKLRQTGARKNSLPAAIDPHLIGTAFDIFARCRMICLD